MSPAAKAFLARPEVVKAEFETVNPWPAIKAELGVSCANPDKDRMHSVLMQAHKIRMCQVEWHLIIHTPRRCKLCVFVKPRYCSLRCF